MNDIAATIEFLLSENAGFITGQPFALMAVVVCSDALQIFYQQPTSLC